MMDTDASPPPPPAPKSSKKPPSTQAPEPPTKEKKPRKPHQWTDKNREQFKKCQMGLKRKREMMKAQASPPE